MISRRNPPGSQDMPGKPGGGRAALVSGRGGEIRSWLIARRRRPAAASTQAATEPSFAITLTVPATLAAVLYSLTRG